MSDLRSAILNIPDLKYDTVFIKEWDMEIRYKTLSGAEKEEFEQMLQAQAVKEFDENGKLVKVDVDQRNLRSKLISLAVVDEKDNNIFTEKDVPLISKKNTKAIDTLYQAIALFNGIGEKAEEQAVKN
jgi:hypothetical protein